MNKYVLKCQVGDHYDYDIAYHHFESDRTIQEERADLAAIWKANQEQEDHNWFDFQFKGKEVYSYWEPEIIPFDLWYARIRMN